jgi:hypothetical protein
MLRLLMENQGTIISKVTYMAMQPSSEECGLLRSIRLASDQD